MASNSTWDIWWNFCNALWCNPYLLDLGDPVPILQVFAHRYWTGEISPSHAPVCGRTVGDAVRAVGQTLSNLGLADPRLLPSGKLTYRLS